MYNLQNLKAEQVKAYARLTELRGLIPNTSEDAELRGYETEIDTLRAAIEKRKADIERAESLDSAVTEGEAFTATVTRAVPSAVTAPILAVTERGGFLERSAEYRGFAKDLDRGNGVVDSAQFNRSPKFRIEARDVIGVGNKVQNERLAPRDLKVSPVDEMLSLFGEVNTDALAVEWLRLTGTNNADFVNEATQSTRNGNSASTSLKPESSIADSLVTFPLKALAHIFVVTRQSLLNATFLQDMIIKYGINGAKERLAKKIKDDLIAGAVNTTAFEDSLIVSLRNAMYEVEDTGLVSPTAVLMNPLDSKTLDLERDDNGHFYFGGPNQVGSSPWGLKVVKTSIIPVGKALVGDFNLTGSILKNTKGGEYEVAFSDSDANNFQHNLTSIRVEGYRGFGLFDPTAYTVVDTVATP